MPIGTITLNKPWKLNAWDTPMRAEITAQLNDWNRDPAVRAVIMTGAGERAFCAGQDLEVVVVGGRDFADGAQETARLLDGVLELRGVFHADEDGDFGPATVAIEAGGDGQRARGVLDLACGVRHVGPAVIGPQCSDERDHEAREPTARSGEGGSASIGSSVSSVTALQIATR